MSIAEALAPELRVVLADDTPEIRTLLRGALERADGIHVIGEAADGNEAVELAGAAHPDAMLLDLAMPVMDGLAAIPEIQRCSPETRIVVLSAFTDGGMGRAAIDAGATAYLAKGVAVADIVAALRGTDEMSTSDPAENRIAPVSAVKSDDDTDAVARLTHELANRIAVIYGFAALLVRDDSVPEVARGYAEVVFAKAGEMRDLLKRVTES